ncbi:ParA family protein [Oscillatoria acuminata]|uniref:ATPase involved in chromosome partitioning n=1 Tax=Oscillatoria acuminata PCC 6304 TaxID=56110 RepID=K9TC72_9CYAN|nr:AAA family ATPase [Oscillatoria acuminata]AFY80135.1 ATPase involved in chromosome partitioning [Oscillatoria acuminata PCC 6304]
MSSYAFWNNKGGVGKSFLSFVAASEYAHSHPDTDVYVIDLCPQAKVSEILFGGYQSSPKAIHSLSEKKPRATIAGYLEARLNSPFRMIEDVSPYLCTPKAFNSHIPENLKLICGDNLLEIISEAIRQTSELSIPADAWKQVLNWVQDLTVALRKQSGDRDTLFVIDCNPSFAIYTQIGLVAAEGVVVPFTADDSSRRVLENVIALLYGITDPQSEPYARISFGKRAKEEGVSVPKLHTFVSNQVAVNQGQPSRDFEAVNQTIKQMMDELHKKHRHIFATPKEQPSNTFMLIPDYQSAYVVATTTGTPLYKLKPGPQNLVNEHIELDSEPLQNYRNALETFVNCL